MSGDKTLLNLLPELWEQHPEVLGQEPDIITWLMRHVWNPQDSAAYQCEGLNGRWGYARETVVEACLPDFLSRHLRGQETWGFYSQSLDNTSRWLCLDLDIKGGSISQEAEDNLLDALGICLDHLDRLGVPEACRLLEFSGGRGIHVWLLLEETPTNYARRFWSRFRQALPALPESIGMDLYPNPQTDAETVEYGSLVKLPFAFHNKFGRFSCLIEADGTLVGEPFARLRSREPWCLPDDLPMPIELKGKSKSSGNKTKRESAKIIKVVPNPEVPHFSHDYRKLYEGCSWIRTFHKRPSSVDYHHWKHAGLILCSVGDTGREWFAYLSSKDAARYDGSHMDLMESVHEDGLRPPSCLTIGCSVCSKTHPLQWLALNGRGIRHVPAEEKNMPRMTLNELHQNLRNELEECLNEDRENTYEGHHNTTRNGQDDNGMSDDRGEESKGNHP